MFKKITRLIFYIYVFINLQISGLEKLEDINYTKREYFENSLNQIKTKVYDTRLSIIQNTYNIYKPTIFISYAWEEDVKVWVDQVLSRDLCRIGFEVLYDQNGIMAGSQISSFEEKVSEATYVVVLCTPQYLKRYNEHDAKTGVGREMKRILKRLKTKSREGTVLPIYRKGDFKESVPNTISQIASFDMQNDIKYYDSFFILSQSLFLYDKNNKEPINGIKNEFLNLIDYKEIKEFFLKGILIYNNNSGICRINLPISKMRNPLDNTFDLSRCGEADRYLTVSTGYKKEFKEENENKIEVWIVPRFLIEKEINTTAKHYQTIFNKWSPTNPIGIFWTWGGWNDLGWFDYQITLSLDQIRKCEFNLGTMDRSLGSKSIRSDRPVHTSHMKNFYISFNDEN
jgi:hypothetical protein